MTPKEMMIAFAEGKILIDKSGVQYHWLVDEFVCHLPETWGWRTSSVKINDLARLKLAIYVPPIEPALWAQALSWLKEGKTVRRSSWPYNQKGWSVVSPSSIIENNVQTPGRGIAGISISDLEATDWVLVQN